MMNHKPHIKWLPQYEEWLKAHYFEYGSISALVEAFNKKFKTRASKESVQQRSRALGLRRGTKPHDYTSEQLEYIRAMHGKYDRKTIYEMFCKHFGINDLGFMAFRSYMANTLHLRLDNRFKFNAKGFEQKRLPVGSVRKQGGMWFIKVNDIVGKRGSHDAEKQNWQEYCRYVWEQHHGKIPDGYSIVFLDGNRDNCSIENLDCVDKRTFCFMQVNHLFCDDAQLTKTGVLAGKVMREVTAPCE